MGNKKYTVELDEEEVRNYWQFIGMSQEAWEKLRPTQQLKIAWDDMLAKQKAAQEAIEKAKQSLDD